MSPEYTKLVGMLNICNDCHTTTAAPEGFVVLVLSSGLSPPTHKVMYISVVYVCRVSIVARYSLPHTGGLCYQVSQCWGIQGGC